MAPTIPAAPGEEDLPALPLDLRLRLAELFVRMDADGSHGLTREELKTALRALGMGSSDEELEERAAAVSAMDSNGDDYVSFTEFMRGMTSVYRAGLDEKGKVTSELLAALDPAADRFSNDEIFRALENPRVVAACKGLRAQDPQYLTYHDYLLRTLRSNGLLLTGRMTRAQLLAAIDSAEPPVLPTQARIRELLDAAAASPGADGAAPDSDSAPLDRRRSGKGGSAAAGANADGSGFSAFADNAGTAVSDSATSVGDFFMSIFTCGSVRVLKKQAQLDSKAMQLAVSSAPHGSSAGSGDAGTSSSSGASNREVDLDDVRQVWGSPEEVEAARVDAARREALARVKGLGAARGAGSAAAASAVDGSSGSASSSAAIGLLHSPDASSPFAASAGAALSAPTATTPDPKSSASSDAAIARPRPTLQPASTSNAASVLLTSSSSASSASSSSSSSAAYALGTPGSATASATAASSSAVLAALPSQPLSRAERIAAELAARARDAEIAFSLEAHASGRVL